MTDLKLLDLLLDRDLDHANRKAIAALRYTWKKKSKLTARDRDAYEALAIVHGIDIEDDRSTDNVAPFDDSMMGPKVLVAPPLRRPL